MFSSAIDSLRTKDLAGGFWRPAPALCAYAAVLAWLNYRMFHEVPVVSANFMNSMHGFWIALARSSQGAWFHPSWWPYWDNGIPFEFTYAPAVPAAIAALTRMLGVSPEAAFYIITGLIYCLAPLTLFLCVWALTRAPGFSFLAALMYSLTSPSQLLAPDADSSLNSIWSARRLFVTAVWDDTPHYAALTLLLPLVLFLRLSLQRRRAPYLIASVILIAAMTLASAFGAALAAIAAICVLIADQGGADPGQRAAQPSPLGPFDAQVSPEGKARGRLRAAALLLFVGAFGYVLASPFLPPSLLRAMRAASAFRETGWSSATPATIAAGVAGGMLLWHYVKRWTADETLRLFWILAYAVSLAPLSDLYFHVKILPQPGRYKLEMDLALTLALVFSLRRWFERLPLSIRAMLLSAAFLGAQAQFLQIARVARELRPPRDVSQTVEFRAATWAQQNLPGVRVMLPVSISQWANAFVEIPQFSGSSWSIAYNPVQQRSLMAQYFAGANSADAARVSLAWLQAFGVGAVAVSSPQSAEYWKGFLYPEKFEGRLPVLWRGDGVTLYRVPYSTPSLAHVLTEDAIVHGTPSGPSDIAPLDAYNHALGDSTLPSAEFTWEGRNRIRIRTRATTDQVISVQVSFHRGWHATANGRGVRLQRDGLGLMWFRPSCNGPCEVQLDYDGGWEIRLCRYLSAAALIGLALWAAQTGIAALGRNRPRKIPVRMTEPLAGVRLLANPPPRSPL